MVHILKDCNVIGKTLQSGGLVMLIQI